MIHIRLLIVPVNAKPIANRCRQSVTNLRYSRGLRLAHPVTMDDTLKIYLPIGVDFYWQIVGDEAMVIQPSTHVSASSCPDLFFQAPVRPSMAWTLLSRGANS